MRRASAAAMQNRVGLAACRAALKRRHVGSLGRVDHLFGADRADAPTLQAEWTANVSAAAVKAAGKRPVLWQPTTQGPGDPAWDGVFTARNTPIAASSLVCCSLPMSTVFTAY